MHPAGLDIVIVVAGDEVAAKEPMLNVIGLNGFVEGKVTLKGLGHHAWLSTTYMANRSWTVTMESIVKVFAKLLSL